MSDIIRNLIRAVLQGDLAAARILADALREEGKDAEADAVSQLFATNGDPAIAADCLLTIAPREIKTGYVIYSPVTDQTVVNLGLDSALLGLEHRALNVAVGKAISRGRPVSFGDYLFSRGPVALAVAVRYFPKKLYACVCRFAGPLHEMPAIPEMLSLIKGSAQ